MNSSSISPKASSGNIDVQGDQPHEKYYHLFEPLPEFLQVIAFLDRLHAYLPGWELPKLSPQSYAQDYGFIADYFCEILHELRRSDPLGPVRGRFTIIDRAETPQGVSGRDQRAILKTASGLMKLIYPDGLCDGDELEEVLLLACELRQRVRNQLHLIAPGEYDRLQLGVRLLPTGHEAAPVLREAGRVQQVTLPDRPQVGEVLGLAVVADHGALLRFEMQATRGNGRIIPLGSIQRVMRESIETAAQYLRANSHELGIAKDWHVNLDVAVLAIYMGIPKEGPSAGVTILMGLASALTGRPVRHDVALTGEITLHGNILAVGGIQQKVRAAYEVGIREVILPADNLAEAQSLPIDLLSAITLTPVSTVAEALAHALLPAPGKRSSGAEAVPPGETPPRPA